MSRNFEGILRSLLGEISGKESLYKQLHIRFGTFANASFKKLYS